MNEIITHPFYERPTRRMTIGVFGIDDETGEQIEIGKPMYIHVPKGCRVVVRCRSWEINGPQMLPFEFDSEKWEQDLTMSEDYSVRRYGLWRLD